MTYRESITNAMTGLGNDPKARFIGYGLKYGRAGGTLSGVADAQIVEMPVAENLLVGVAHGLSLCGFLPVVYIERFDFALNAADAIINHLLPAHDISRGEFRPAAWIRCVVGNSDKPLFTGRTHTQDFGRAFEEMGCSVRRLIPENVTLEASGAELDLRAGKTVLTIEYKDLL